MKHPFRLLILLSLFSVYLLAEENRPSFVAAPAVSSSPGFGNGLGVVGLMFFRPEASDQVSPNSTLTLIGLYSDTDSFFLGAFAPLYLKEDRWRVTPGLVSGRVKSDLNVGLPQNAKFENEFLGSFLKVLRRVQGDWYAGVQVMLIDQKYRAQNPAGELYFEQFGVEDTTSGVLSAVVAMDSRNDQRYPTGGQNLELTLGYAPEGLAEEEAYTTSQLMFSSFHPVKKQVFAWQTFAKTVSDDAPYFERPTLGQRGDLRGYTPGELIGDHSISLQAEIRAFFTPRLGGVVFGGVGALWEDDLSSDDLYPSYGLGLRLRIQEENKVNFRIDYAVGEQDQDGWYISVSEAF